MQLKLCMLNFYKKNGRDVLKPNKSPSITPEINHMNVFLGLLIKRLLLMRYHRLTNICSNENKEK